MNAHTETLTMCSTHCVRIAVQKKAACYNVCASTLMSTYLLCVSICSACWLLFSCLFIQAACVCVFFKYHPFYTQYAHTHRCYVGARVRSCVQLFTYCCCCFLLKAQTSKIKSSTRVTMNVDVCRTVCIATVNVHSVLEQGDRMVYHTFAMINTSLEIFCFQQINKKKNKANKMMKL